MLNILNFENIFHLSSISIICASCYFVSLCLCHIWQPFPFDLFFFQLGCIYFSLSSIYYYTYFIIYFIDSVTFNLNKFHTRIQVHGPYILNYMQYAIIPHSDPARPVQQPGPNTRPAADHPLPDCEPQRGDARGFHWPGPALLPHPVLSWPQQGQSEKICPMWQRLS